MNNFEIIKLNNVEDNILIVMKTSEPPFDFLSEMEEALRNIQYLGYVTIDELLHSGNGLFRAFLMGILLKMENSNLLLLKRRVN